MHLKTPAQKEAYHEKGHSDPSSGTGLMKLGLLFIVLILLGSGVTVYHDVANYGQDKIYMSNISISGYNSTGYIDSLNLTVEFPGTSQLSVPLYFRIIQSGPVLNGNGNLWINVKNMTLTPGIAYQIKIAPQFPGFALNSSRAFLVIAYYGELQGSFYYGRV